MKSKQIELMVFSGCAATNAKVHTIWDVSHKKKKKTSSFPFFAPLMSVGGRNLVKLVRAYCKQTCSEVGNFFIRSGKAKEDQKTY